MISAPLTKVSRSTSATWTVVVSRGQSRNPAKRGVEQAVVDSAAKLPGVDVLVVPHLYDLPRGSESFASLDSVPGNLVVVSWIFPRAAHWVLDRNGIQGQFGEVLLGADEDSPEDPALDLQDPALGLRGPAEETSRGDRVVDLHPRPDRMIHCVDFKSTESATDLLAEVRRITRGELQDAAAGSPVELPIVGGAMVQVDESTSRRWYPVIDFSRCTNCMECVDFCLFGVYGVDGVENILVEQPDNCRKGCPACSRVCPENAIIFPQHKAPAIAGAEIEGDEGFKIDLSQLFGAPSDKADPIETAARERDEQLLLAGRETVGIDDQLRKRQQDLSSQPKDHLDSLIDSLDDFDL